MTIESRIAELTIASLQQTLTVADQEELKAWRAADPGHELLFTTWVNVEHLGAEYQARVKRNASIAARIAVYMEEVSASAERPAARISFLRSVWFRYAAAILLLCGIGAYFFISKKPSTQLVQSVPATVPPDVLPGLDKAVLTLGDGSAVVLDSSAGNIIRDGTVAIENIEGRLVYRRSQQSVNNTMTTPKGGQYRLTLADGTKVWLNAASSITYPTAFLGRERSVLVTGEVYFEVAKNAAQPFMVRTRKEIIQVLGTSFNVNAYADEPMVKTSLLEGVVKVDGTLLQQGHACVNGKVMQTNVQQDVAWKNGIFNFNGADLPQVLRQLSRWYDIDIKFANGMKKRTFRGELSRNLPLSEVLAILKDLEVNYIIEGKTLIIQ